MIDGYLLGIDPSTACGFAVLRPDGTRVQSGVWQLSRKGDHAGARFVRVQEHLSSLRATWPAIVSVAYEVPGRFDTQAAYLAVYGIATHVESWCEREGLHYAAFAPAEVKRAAGCKGNAGKPEMIAAMGRRFALEHLTDDEADALACALAGLADLGCSLDLQLQPTQAPKRAALRDPLADFYGDPA